MNANKLLLLRRANFIGRTFRHYSVANSQQAWCSSTALSVNCGRREKNRHHLLLLLTTTTFKVHSQQQHFCTNTTTLIELPDQIEQKCTEWAQIARAEWEAQNARYIWDGKKLRCKNVVYALQSSRIVLSTEDLNPEQLRSLRQFYQVGNAVELNLKDFPQENSDSIGPTDNSILGIVNNKFPDAIEISVNKYFNLQQRQWLQRCSFDIKKAVDSRFLENQLNFLVKRHSDWCKWPGYATMQQAFKCQPLPEDTGVDPTEWVGSHGKDPSQCAALSAALNLKRPIVAVHGPPGSGKTRLLTEYLHVLSQQNKRVLVLSPSLPAFYHLMGTFCKKFPSAASSAGTFLCLKRFDAQMASKVIADKAVERLIEARTFVGLTKEKQDEEVRKYYELTRTLKSTMEDRQDYSGEEDLKREAEDMFKEMRETGFQQIDEMTKDLLQSKLILFMPNSIAWLNLFTRTGLTFDVVIIDDAARMSEFESWVMALPTAPVLRLFGDYNQYGTPVYSSIGRELNFNKSLLQRLDEDFGEELNFHLRRQYRSNAAIQAWPNRAFYGQRAAEPDESVRNIRLDDLLEEGKSSPQGLITDPLVLVDLSQLEGEWRDCMLKVEKGGKSWHNWGEAFLAASQLWHLFEHIPQLHPSKIAYLTRYDAQRNLLWRIFSTLSERNLQKLRQIRMEHSKYLQDQQFDVMLRDSVTVPPPDALVNPYHLKHLSNEMCRARRQFIWFANSKWLEQGSEQSRQLLQTFREYGRIVGPNQLLPLEPGQFWKISMKVQENFRRMQQEQRMRTNVHRS